MRDIFFVFSRLGLAPKKTVHPKSFSSFLSKVAKQFPAIPIASCDLKSETIAGANGRQRYVDRFGI